MVQINAERLWRRHMEMARFGATPGGGVCRLALDTEDIRAHVALAERALARDFTLLLDPVGNLFIRKAGKEPDLAPVVSGSHMDSQPTGGRFDGIFGVLAAFSRRSKPSTRRASRRAARSNASSGTTRRARAFAPAAWALPSMPASCRSNRH